MVNCSQDIAQQDHDREGRLAYLVSRFDERRIAGQSLREVTA